MNEKMNSEENSPMLSDPQSDQTDNLSEKMNEDICPNKNEKNNSLSESQSDQIENLSEKMNEDTCPNKNKESGLQSVKPDNSQNQKRKRSSPKIFQCANCAYFSPYRSALISHQMSHRSSSETTMYKCEVCGHETKRKADLRAHMIIHKDPEEVKLFYCANCPYWTKRKCDLKQHVVIHLQSLYKCLYCPFQTKNKLYLDRDHALIHKDESEVVMFKCESCSYEANSKVKLKLHKKVHQEVKTKFMCNWCNREFRTKSGIKEHMLVHTCPSEMEMFRCAQCDFECKRKAGLKDHIKHKHMLLEKKYICAHCPFRSTSRGSLRHHLKLHRNPNEVEKFVCDVCGYSTLRKGNLKQHTLKHDKRQGLLNDRRNLEQSNDNFLVQTLLQNKPKDHQIGNLEHHIVTAEEDGELLQGHQNPGELNNVVPFRETQIKNEPIPSEHLDQSEDDICFIDTYSTIQDGNIDQQTQTEIKGEAISKESLEQLNDSVCFIGTHSMAQNGKFEQLALTHEKNQRHLNPGEYLTDIQIKKEPILSELLNQSNDDVSYQRLLTSQGQSNNVAHLPVTHITNGTFLSQPVGQLNDNLCLISITGQGDLEQHVLNHEKDQGLRWHLSQGQSNGAVCLTANHGKSETFPCLAINQSNHSVCLVGIPIKVEDS